MCVSVCVLCVFVFMLQEAGIFFIFYGFYCTISLLKYINIAMLKNTKRQIFWIFVLFLNLCKLCLLIYFTLLLHHVRRVLFINDLV